MFAIAPTDNSWINFLKQNEFNSFVNFWTPTPWNIKDIKPGDKWFFLLKAPIRKIAGFGEFVEYKNLNALNAWNEFGRRNGTDNIDIFLNKIESYVLKNSKQIILDPKSHIIGCIVLNNCQFWDEDLYRSPDESGVDFKNQIVKYKYFRDFDNLGFQLLKEPREQYKKEVNQRKGHGIFKGIISKAYNNTCCISGETCPELLEAAHIQPYLNTNSNHVQNGLLLRVDLHRLFDNGLLLIDENYIVHISSLLKKSIYKKLNGQKIHLPQNAFEHPSIEGLATKKTGFRKS